VLLLMIFPAFFILGVIVGLVFGEMGELTQDLILRFFPSVTFMLLIAFFLFKNKHNRNDNTSGVIGVYGAAEQIAANLELKAKVAFVLFDNEEWGLLGAAAFAKWRKKNCPDKKLAPVINLDCVGVGETLLLAATKKHEGLRALADFMAGEGFTAAVKKSVLVYMSDHASFKRGVMFSYVKKSKLGPYYLPYIHTRKDTACDVERIGALSEAVAKYIGGVPA